MKNTCIIVKLIFVFMIAALVSCDSMENHSEPTSSTVVATPSQPQTQEITPTPTSAPTFEEFDTNYKNAVTFNSRIAAKDNKIFYTKEGYLYCYDSISNTKVMIDNNTHTANGNIHVSAGYVYYLKKETFNRVNIDTLEVEVVLEAKTVANQLHEKRSKTAGFCSFLMNDNLTMLIIWLDDGTGDSYIYVTLSKINEWKLSHIDRGQLHRQIQSLKEISLLDETILFVRDFAVAYFDANMEVLTIDRARLTERDIENMKFYSSQETSGNQTFLTTWPESSHAMHGIDLESDEDTYYKKLNGLFMAPKALNQYLFCYYFDRLQIANDEKGAIIIDTKHNKVYENEEINSIISGDMNYTRMQNTSYYLDGDVLYVLEEI